MEPCNVVIDCERSAAAIDARAASTAAAKSIDSLRRTDSSIIDANRAVPERLSTSVIAGGSDDAVARNRTSRCGCDVRWASTSRLRQPATRDGRSRSSVGTWAAIRSHCRSSAARTRLQGEVAVRVGGRRYVRRARTPTERLHVLEDVGHVQQVLVVAEPAVAGVHEVRPPGLAGAVRQHLRPLHRHVLALDGDEVDGEAPVLQPAHALVEERADGVDAFDASVRGVDVHGVVGEERGEIRPRLVAALDRLTALEVGAYGLLGLRPSRHQMAATRPYKVVRCSSVRPIGSTSARRSASSMPWPCDAPAAREMFSFINVPPRSLTPARSSCCAPARPSLTHDACTLSMSPWYAMRATAWISTTSRQVGPRRALCCR